MTDEDELGAVGNGVGGGRLLRPELTGVVAAQPLGVGPVHHREVQRRIEPAITIADELGIHREARREHMPLRLGHLAQPIEVGPRPLRVDVVGGHGGHATPVVDAGIEQRAEVVGQVRWRLEVDLRRQDQPGGSDGPEVVVARTCPDPLHRGPQLRQEVLDDHLLNVAMASVRGRDRLQSRELIGPGVADAHENAGGERDLQLAGSFERRQAALGRLVGRATMGLEVRIDRLDHHPLTRAERPDACELVCRECAGVGVR